MGVKLWHSNWNEFILVSMLQSFWSLQTGSNSHASNQVHYIGLPTTIVIMSSVRGLDVLSYLGPGPHGTCGCFQAVRYNLLLLLRVQVACKYASLYIVVTTIKNIESSAVKAVWDTSCLADLIYHLINRHFLCGRCPKPVTIQYLHHDTPHSIHCQMMMDVDVIITPPLIDTRSD